MNNNTDEPPATTPNRNLGLGFRKKIRDTMLELLAASVAKVLFIGFGSFK